MATVLIVSGSPRPENWTRRAVDAVARLLAAAGPRVDILDLAQSDYPVFRGEPVAPVGLAWRQRVRAADALILATPEYHGGMSSAIKTFLDYLTFEELRDRPVGLMGVAQGPHGGQRAALQVQDVVAVLWSRVVGPIVQVHNCREAFDDLGNFRDPLTQRLAGLLVARLTPLLPPPASPK